MPSPFPGMDPYLEGYLWPDVHHALATKIRQQLMPYLRPRYVARLEVAVVQDNDPAAEIGIMYPDVEIIERRQPIKEATVEYQAAVDSAEKVESREIPPAPVTLRLLEPVEVRLVTVEIRQAGDNRLITAIEILSPVNKREPNLSRYRQKRQRFRQAGVHLLEIDLLRRGQRPWRDPRLPAAAYLVTLMRAATGQIEVWPLALTDRMPVVPVPLRGSDPDTPLDLATALTAIYDEAAYDLSIDYTQPPPPPALSAEEAAWINEVIEKDTKNE